MGFDSATTIYSSGRKELYVLVTPAIYPFFSSVAGRVILVFEEIFYNIMPPLFFISFMFWDPNYYRKQVKPQEKPRTDAAPVEI